jgi:hypothetical protein
MKNLLVRLRVLVAALFLMLPGLVLAGEIERFEGEYAGSAEFVYQGEVQQRDMSTRIEATKNGFVITWTSVSYKSDGRIKEKTYTIEFTPSAREHIYKSAMKSNLFGKAIPLDPLQGEPFVWARVDGETFTVYSLFINEVGDYEIQEYHRTLVEEGLDLRFQRVHNGVPQKEIRTLLKRIN